jgi:hypothetical protein
MFQTYYHRSKQEAPMRKSTVKDSIGLPFTVFRARDAVDYTEEGPMTGTPITTAEAEGGEALVRGGMLDGSHLKLMFSRPGLSLTYVWFKSGFPLPRHSHSADCLYVIIAGSLRIGTEELGPGDGFFIGTDVPYAYTPGSDGVEVLEIRTANNFDIKLLANNPAWWDKAAERLAENRVKWPEQTPPSGWKVG